MCCIILFMCCMVLFMCCIVPFYVLYSTFYIYMTGVLYICFMIMLLCIKVLSCVILLTLSYTSSLLYLVSLCLSFAQGFSWALSEVARHGTGTLTIHNECTLSLHSPCYHTLILIAHCIHVCVNWDSIYLSLYYHSLSRIPYFYSYLPPFSLSHSLSLYITLSLTALTHSLTALTHLLHCTHRHGDAWNAIAFGEKRWSLLPPAKATFSNKHSYHTHFDLSEYHTIHHRNNTGNSGDTSSGGDIIGDNSDNTGNTSIISSGVTDALHCVQEAGDVIYVPTGWAHAILNTKETIGIAAEFRYTFNHFA